MSQPTVGYVISASKLAGGVVKNTDGETLGDIKEIMIDTSTGRVAYAVLSFGGFLGMGDKLFALPWNALQSHQTEPSAFVLNANKERLQAAPGFDKNNWPNFADRKWGSTIHDYYQIKPYW
jgi:sporulation protein YlmC with PRC-barrel domain